MEADLVCHVLSFDHLVVELHEALTAPAPALELHVVASSDGTSTIAWWEDDDGSWLRDALVGRS